MGKVPIGAAVFAKPINGIYNTIYQGHTYKHWSNQLLKCESAFLNLGGCRAMNNAKMALGPAIDRASNPDKELTYVSTVINTISTQGLL